MPRHNRRRTVPWARPRNARTTPRPDGRGLCPDCGKTRYPSQRAAAKAGDYAKPAPGCIAAVAYPCPSSPGWWHFGHKRPDDAPSWRAA